jgi:hypothetical protein
MNVYSADMTSSEIANLTILVKVQNVKTFYQNNMQTTEFNNSPISTTRPLTSNFKSLNMSKNCLLSLPKQFCLSLFQIYKVFIRTEYVGNEIPAMQVVNIFLNKYSC